MLCYSVETMAVRCWRASEKEGLKLSTKSVEEDQGPVCIWAYCRWIFNGQVICLPQTEKTPLKCKLTSSDLSRAQPWYAIVCVVPGKGRVWQSLEDSKALCKTGWCLGGQRNSERSDSLASSIHAGGERLGGTHRWGCMSGLLYAEPSSVALW